MLRASSNALFACILFLGSLCEAAPRAYRFEQWNTERGLPQNTVLSIVQSRDGYLWIGTRFGFARFDGVRFTTFNVANTPGMPCENCYAIREDVEGSLWIGSNEGLIRRKNNLFELFTTSHGLGSKSVRRIVQGRSGALWVGTGLGLARFQNGTFTNEMHELGVINDRTDVFEDSTRCVWYNTPEGLYRWPFETGHPQLLVPRTVLGGSRARCFVEDRKQRVWFGNADGLFCWSSNRLDHYAPEKSDHADTKWPNMVQVAFHTGEDDLWVTLSEKNVLHRFVDGKFVLFRGVDDKRIEYVTTGLQDREGTIWIGTRFSGLIAVQPVPFNAICARDGLREDNVLTVCQGRDGSVWVGTSEGNLSRVRGRQIESFTLPEMPARDVLSVFEDDRATLWVGTRKGDPSRSVLRFRDGVFECVNKELGIVSECISAIYQDRSGTLWFGTRDGLFRFKDGASQKYTTKDGLSINNVRGILEDRTGALWIGTHGGGVNVLRDGKFEVFTTTNGLASNKAWMLHEDREGTMWIGTETGLTRYRDDKFFTFTRKHGMYDDLVNWILEDESGNMWISCNRGISRVSKKELTDVAEGRADTVRHIAYGVADGMLSSETNGENQPAGCKTREGTLWFPTIEGLVSIDPSRAQDNSVTPLVVIEQVTVDDEVVIGNGLQVPKSNGSVPNAFTLAPRRGRVMQIQYTANSFIAADKVRFKYRLRGHDRDWRDVGTDRVAYYTNLKPGDYTFEVMAANSHDRWNEKAGSFAFTLSPHFTQTEAFWVAIGLAVTAVGLGLHFIRLRYVRRLQVAEQFQAVEMERKRIAQDMHDDLGSSLTQISLQTELAARAAKHPDEFRAQLQKIGETTRDVFYSLDEIIWTTNPRNDALESLVSFIAKYAEEFLRPAEIACRVDFPAMLPARVVSASLRHDLVLAVKEALTNVVKHSGAQEVWLTATWTDPRLELTIRDNGRGLPQGNSLPAPDADGLLNIRQRLEANGGKMTIATDPEGGAMVRMIIPVSKRRAAAV